MRPTKNPDGTWRAPDGDYRTRDEAMAAGKGVHRVRLGPVEGSTSDRAIGLIERGVNTKQALAEALDLRVMDVHHNLRTHVRSGLLDCTGDAYKLTVWGELILEGKT